MKSGHVIHDIAFCFLGDYFCGIVGYEMGT